MPGADPITADARTGDRLAELVAHLTGCGPNTARGAVEDARAAAAETLDDRLAVVARAVVSVRTGQLELAARRTA
jgi:predicted small secreted protein